MGDHFVVQIGYAFQYLIHDVLRLSFAEAGLGVNRTGDIGE